MPAMIAEGYLGNFSLHVHMPASRTHVIQVIGRALRPHPDKRMAVVVLPIVSDASETAAKRARATERRRHDVLSAERRAALALLPGWNDGP